MKAIDRLRAHLVREYEKKTRKSRAEFARAEQVLIGGGSHSIRLWRPYPFFAVRAEGPRVEDIDGNDYVDYWQGHYANILGHNPPLIRKGVMDCLESGALHTGFEAGHQVELAELIVRELGGAGLKIRFTTSGTLATMYAVMLAQGRTGRELVLKVGGGWHGSSPYLLKGIKYHRKDRFAGRESAGVLDDIFRRTLITKFNDGDDLQRIFRSKGDRIACFIVEPFMGVGGFFPASKEYLELARALTRRHGALLIFDEIVSGYRFAATGLQTLYGVEPDLSAFGKIIGGGHAVAAVAGDRRIMEGCERVAGGRHRVLFEGGTFSAHSEYMKAGLIMLGHLARKASSIYPRLALAGDRLRTGIERVFAAEGIEAKCSGSGNEVVPGSSLFMVHFPKKGVSISGPQDVLDDQRSDVVLREEILKLALLVHGVNVVHGGGAVSVSHQRKDLERTIEAYGEAAKLFKKFLY